jgi:hypothetical protein
VFGVDQRGIGGFRRVVPFAGCCFSAGVLRGGDDLEILIVKFGVKLLPAWQI